MYKKISTTDAEEIRRAYKAGVPSRKLAEYYNITIRRVQQICNRGEEEAPRVIVRPC